MPNLSDFLKCEKVRCVNKNGYVDLTDGKEYKVTAVKHVSKRICIIDNVGEEYCYPYGIFAPVLETAIQATDALDDTPMGTRTVNEFEAGDRVYWATNPEIYTIHSINNHVIELMWNEDCETAYLKEICHATPENYEMLCKLYPHIEFEAPPKKLTGSDLCRAMLDKGWRYVLCDTVLGLKIISQTKDDGFYDISGVFYTEADNIKPFDLRTGKYLTSEVLDD